MVAINRFPTDTDEEISTLLKLCAQRGHPAALAEHWAKGGEGAEQLAEMVLDTIENRPPDYHPLYELDQPLRAKIEIIAREMYGAAGVDYTLEARKKLADLEKLGFGGLPVCMAKTQNSLSTTPCCLAGRRVFRLRCATRRCRPARVSW